MCLRNSRAQGQSSTEVAGTSHHFSSLNLVVRIVKLSVETRVCCTDEMPTWSSYENFNTSTGTCHLISSSHSRTSSLPFAQSHTNPQNVGSLGRANREVGDVTAILLVLSDDEKECQVVGRVKIRPCLPHLQTQCDHRGARADMQTTR